MINRACFLLLVSTVVMLLQGCTPKKEASEENVLIITNTEEYLSFVSDYNTGKFHINDSLISPLVVNLENNISIIEDHVMPIGTEEYPFIGKFNGNGHTISCCGIGKDEAADNVGLFGYVKNSEIKNFTIVTDEVVGAHNVGIVCGYAYLSNISDCKVSGKVTGISHVGGVVGSASYGGISDCYFVGDVAGTDFLVGGIAGMMEFGGVIRTYAGGEVSGRTAVNPIIGNNTEDVLVSECVDRMNVKRSCKRIKQDVAAADKLTRLLFSM